MHNFILRSPRIGFSVWHENDFDLAWELWADPKVCRYISKVGVFSLNEIKERLSVEIKQYEMYKVQYFPMFELSSNTFIGVCGLRPYNVDNSIYEVGCHLKSEYWGKGYASEAIQCMIDYSFNELKVSGLFAGHHPENKSSRKLLQRNGFKYIKDEYYEPTQLKHPSYLLMREH